MGAIRHGRPRALPFDLFGEIPVCRDDVLLWMLAVPQLAPDSPRWAAYVRDYNVLEKIRAAKLAGTFDATVAHAFAAPPVVTRAWRLAVEYHQRDHRRADRHEAAHA